MVDCMLHEYFLSFFSKKEKGMQFQFNIRRICQFGMPHEVWQHQIGITFSKVNLKGLEFACPDSYPSADDFSE